VCGFVEVKKAIAVGKVKAIARATSSSYYSYSIEAGLQFVGKRVVCYSEVVYRYTKYTSPWHRHPNIGAVNVYYYGSTIGSKLIYDQMESGISFVHVVQSGVRREPQSPQAVFQNLGINVSVFQSVGCGVGIGTFIDSKLFSVEFVESVAGCKPHKAISILKRTVNGTLR
jgi:hypothetical protein